MGRKEKQQQQKPSKQNGNGSGKKQQQEELLKTLGDFTSKENWDQFFTIRGSDDPFEWYAEWPQLHTLLTTHLLLPSPEEVSILVPGCGNSKLSEHLYDAGFKNITNVDFSKVVISDMLRRNVRERPGMKWRVMDMTNMQSEFEILMTPLSHKEREERLNAAGNKLLQPPSSIDELLPLLDRIEELLSKVEQSPAKSMQTAVSPLMKALVAEELVKHSDNDVKVGIASCISAITRITAPDAPYDDEKMKDVFQLIVSSFQDLSNTSSRSHGKRVTILETMAKVRSCVIMLDLECDQMIIEMFQHFIQAIGVYHPEGIFASLETIMTLVLEDSEDISSDVLNPILATLKRSNEAVMPIAKKLAERVIQNCADKLRPCLTQAVKTLDAFVDDYIEVVASLCRENSGKIRCAESNGINHTETEETMSDANYPNKANFDHKLDPGAMSKTKFNDLSGQEPVKFEAKLEHEEAQQFVNESFGAIVDKGGLDALMEPELGPRLGNLYLSEVKRLLKGGGKYICLTLAESHVLDLLFAKFRFGWKMSLYGISQEPSPRKPKLQTFMVVAAKDISTVISEISSFMGEYSVESHGNQARELYEALEREKRVRSEYSNGSDVAYSIEDLNLGVKGNLTDLEPGRRVKLTLGEPGVSRFLYNGVLLDAQKDSGPFSYPFGVFLVPRMRAHEWIFSSEEGQWVIVESSKAARLVMILLDSSNSNADMEDIQKDLSPLVKQLAPGDCHDGVQIPFMAASDGIKQRKIVHQVTSALTGPIVVDDVIYEKIDDDLSRQFSSKDLIFRRLTFQRSESLVQSEGLLSAEVLNGISSEVERNRVQTASKNKKKGKQRTFDSHRSESHGEASSSKMEVYHNYLASSYHNGIISGLMLISKHLEEVASAGGMVKTVVIGLGAGLLPMFMKKCLPSLEIEVVELDPVVLDVASNYFGFREDERLKVHITDGIMFVREKADIDAEGKGSSKIDILIVDVDSSDSSSGLSCPAADFVEESFLLAVKIALSEQGFFVINLVSRSSAVKTAVYSRLKMVFSNLFYLQLEEDVNEVIFALKTDSDQFSEEAISVVARSLALEKQEWAQRIIHALELIKPLP
ncbi:hypothetical protein BUALT_Bualt09G0016200 [Buddleja alternifolia]|uniref:Methyltransferase-like protein 13 n=1 Tax=Buddleja alternifolia TaxID=168488 RepID=A0AAV6X5R7_9LAMI|nr:hypothetical protein BUALT_Bualt09G0016200 [Buddleja alternifolia]